MKNKILQFIFITILGVLLLPVANVKAVNLIDVQFENTPLFNEANILPGDSVSRWVKVDNVSPDEHVIATKADNVSDPDGLASQLMLVISENGTELFSDTLANFFSYDGISLSALSSGVSTQYDYAVSFKDGADNDYQGKLLSFDILVAEGTDETIGGGGETGGGGGGGGSYVHQGLTIFNEGMGELGSDYAIITWVTNKMATSRVVYDTISHADLSGTQAPNYGYAFSNVMDPNKVTGHSMRIEGLKSGQKYYFRPISSASPEKYGVELSFETTESGEVKVLGEEGNAELSLAHSSLFDFANPGSTADFKISLKNNGKMTVFGVVLTGQLPDGMAYSTNQTNKNVWEIGDLLAGESKEIIYKVDISDQAESVTYINALRVDALNYKTIEAPAELKVKGVSVLGVELVPTGFSTKEFVGLLSILLIISMSIIVLKRKEI